MPWLTVLTAFLTITGVLLAGDKSAVSISLYVVSLIVFYCLAYLNILKLSKSLVLLSFIPLLILGYTYYHKSTILKNSQPKYVNRKVIPCAKFISQAKALNVSGSTIKSNTCQNSPGEIICLVNNKLLASIDHLRQTITNIHLHNLGQKAGSLLASMVLGDRAAALDKQLLNVFRELGLSHIVAASGFNLTIVTLVTYWLARKLSLPRDLVTCIVCANVIFYAALAGLSASIVRAAITCILVLTAHHYYRRLHSMAALSFVLIVNSIVDPKVITQTGAQLSYAAVAGIIFGASALAKTLSFGSENKVITKCTAAISVILMAQLSVLPVQLYHFRQTSILFLPANLIVDPFVTPVTIIGFMASLISLINLPCFPIGLFICQGLDWLAAIPLQIIIYIVEKLANCDLSVVNTGQPLLISIIFYYLTLLAFILFLSRARLRLLGLLLLLCGFLALFYQPELKRAILIFLPDATIAINNHRQAICFGDRDSKANKIIAYYGASTSELQKLAKDKNKLCPQFELYSKQNKILLSKKLDASATANGHYFILTNQAKTENSPKNYVIRRHKIDCAAFNSAQTDYAYRLSLSQFKKELPSIEIKTYSSKAISCYVLSQ